MRGDLFWAVTEHVRTWLGDDGPFRHMIEKQNGCLDGITLRRIAIAYNVSRGIRKGADGVDHAGALAQIINNASPWPSDLRARAYKCLEIAKEAQSRGHTTGLQASGLTKFSWFVQPDCWTVYDRFVAGAMKVRGGAPEAKVMQFYEELEKRGFVDVAKQVQAQVDKWQTMPLFGARVLDKFMMLSGARETGEFNWANSFVWTAKSFLEILPDEWRQSVERLAESVETTIDGRDFLRR
jgi:hypothetical protein